MGITQITVEPKHPRQPEMILLVEDLWDSIASDGSGVPIPQSHMKELDRRLKSYESDPGNLLFLEELQERIERRK